jgi:protein disulfide-isomerase A1
LGSFLIHYICVDGVGNSDLCEKYDIKGFPTLKIFRADGSAPAEYNAGRTSDAITKFMEKQLAPAYIEAKSEAEVRAQIGSEVVVVGFFASKSGEAVDAFIKTAKTLRNDYTFVLVTENAAAVAPAFDAEVPDVVVFKPFNEPAAEYDGEYSYEALSLFIKNEVCFFPFANALHCWPHLTCC